MSSNISKYDFEKYWGFDFITKMKNNETYIFTTTNGSIFVEHDCNLDLNNTFGWSIAIFDKYMNNLECFGLETIYDLECDFKEITRTIIKYLSNNLFCLKDFNKKEFAYKTALAEIENKKIFDEFGNLIKEID